MCPASHMREISEPSPQFCCEAKTALTTTTTKSYVVLDYAKSDKAEA